MKTKTKSSASKNGEATKNKTVKISDSLHHEIRVLAVEKRIPLQSFIEQVLRSGLERKVYDKFKSEKTAA